MKRIQVAVLYILLGTSLIFATQSTPRRAAGAARTIDSVATDYLLVATLTLSSTTPVARDREALVPQLRSLLEAHGIDISARRTTVVPPKGAFMRATGGLFFFWSDSTWYDPLELTYSTRGSLPQMYFMGRYDMTLVDGQFKLALPDGFRARLDGTEYVIQSGKWRAAQ